MHPLRELTLDLVFRSFALPLLLCIHPLKLTALEYPGFVTALKTSQQRAKVSCRGSQRGEEDAQSPALPAEGDMVAGRPAGLCRRALLSSIALGTSVAASSLSVGTPSQWMTESSELASLEALIGLRVLPAEAKEAKEAKVDETKLLEQNKKIQRLNGAPANFPNFIREGASTAAHLPCIASHPHPTLSSLHPSFLTGFNVKVVIGPEYSTTPSGLIYLDITPGSGETPVSGQQVLFWEPRRSGVGPEGAK